MLSHDNQQHDMTRMHALTRSPVSSKTQITIIIAKARETF